jgi:two-component system chemotaxis response regulator CheB
LKNSTPSKIVLIGASTGGPGQIEKIINALPKLHDTSVIIAQHMALGFMPSFAKRLKENRLNPIAIVKSNDSLRSGTIYICCGLTKITKRDSEFIFYQEKSPQNSFNPNINNIFNSFITFTKEIQILSVILTGIGDDGVEACKKLSECGSICITESHSSAIVDGMPSRARKEIQNIKVQDMKDIVNSIKEFCS